MGRRWGASVARCPPNRAYRLRSDSECLIVVGTYQWPDNGGTMPGERYAFTARVEPVSPPYLAIRFTLRTYGAPRSDRDPNMVEAPGTAPGSTTLIPHTVYRHSRETRRTGI